MLFRVEGSPQTGSTSVSPLQTQKVGSHLGVLLPRGGQGVREHSLPGWDKPKDQSAAARAPHLALWCSLSVCRTADLACVCCQEKV